MPQNGQNENRGGVRSQLIEDGYAVVPQVLDPHTIDALQTFTDRILDEQEERHFEQFRFHGSMIPLTLDRPMARRLAGFSGTLASLRLLGFERPKWMSGYIISKPPHSPSLWWHQDWWAWDDAVSFGETPPQLFVMYYLTDVGPENGCLRVIPGSHRRQHSLHTALPEAHGAEVGQTQPEDVAHRFHPDEIDLTIKAGDIVVGDVRLLHATHQNRSDRRRTCLTTWYLPAFDDLPDGVKAYVVQHPLLPPVGWWQSSDTVASELRDLLPVYDGDAAPVSYNRVPPRSWGRESENIFR